MSDHGPRGRHPSEEPPACSTRVITTMTWIVLGLVPVLWVAELVGPGWLNMVLRATWVAAALGTAIGGCRLILSRRRAGAFGPRR